MFEEPYRWVEAIRNRREYLDEQLSVGSPIVALPYEDGILMATFGDDTPKLFEVYDRIAFGGIGHPADLEKLRNVVLDNAHVEGFNRSPDDVSVRRLMQFGLAPMVKQGFEEVLHAPFITKIGMVEIHPLSASPLFFRLNYDGVFESTTSHLILAGTAEQTRQMETTLSSMRDKNKEGPIPRTFDDVLKVALRTWAASGIETDSDDKAASESPTTETLDQKLRETLKDRSLEVILLDQTTTDNSKCRIPSQSELDSVLPGWLR